MAGQGIKMTHDDFMHLGNGELKDCLSLRGMITSGNIYTKTNTMLSLPNLQK